MSAIHNSCIEHMSAALPGCRLQEVETDEYPVAILVTHNGRSDLLKITEGEVACNGLDEMFLDARCKTVAMRFEDG